MKTSLTSLFVLLISGSAVLSDTADRSVFSPASETVAEPVKRAVTGKLTMGTASLAPADVNHVDMNKDGKISFAELLAHDLKLDF